MPLFEIASFYFEANWCQIIFLFDIRFVVFVNFAEDLKFFPRISLFIVCNVTKARMYRFPSALNICFLRLSHYLKIHKKY